MSSGTEYGPRDRIEQMRAVEVERDRQAVAWAKRRHAADAGPHPCAIGVKSDLRYVIRAIEAEPRRRCIHVEVDKDGGALMKLEGYDWNGKLAKRFTVVSGQKIEGRWYLKEMRIEAFDPVTGKSGTRTYLEIKK